MLLKYKIIIAVVVVAILAAVGITLGVVLTKNDAEEITREDVCETPSLYWNNRKTLRNNQIPHFLKNLRHGPPDIAPRNRAKTPEWAWLSQKLDHFNPSDGRTWQMRYLYNDEFYEEGGPMFIFLGGEWTITYGYMMTGQTYDMAEQHKGYLFYTEHRYYGESMPTENLCTENLQYLSADQAMADIIHFIEYQRNAIPSLKNSKVVVVGASYSATLATWIRIKYPHSVDVSYSSSAPLLAIEDFYEYYEVVTDNINLISEECVSTVEEAIREIEETLKTDEGIEKVSEDFGTCWKLNTSEPHRSYFFSSLISPFARVVQYANQGSIEEMCDSILEHEGSPYEKFKGFIKMTNEPYCIGDYDYLLSYLDNPFFNGIDRAWFYQTCTEYGFYQTTSSDRILFGKHTVNVDLYRNICEAIFGVTPDMLEAGIKRTNMFYGALEPVMTRVVSVHGTVDPWHSIGVLEDVNPEAPVFVVKGTSHCADLTSESSTDLPDMIDVKRKVKELVGEWIRSEDN